VTTEPEKIYPPWSDEDTALLNEFQDGHPTEAMLCTQEHYTPATYPMRATILGMSCVEEGCGYLQEWAYANMLEGAPGS
jgi:hypothetical protein